MSKTFDYKKDLATLMENDFQSTDSRNKFIYEQFVLTGHAMSVEVPDNRGPFYIWDDNFENCYRVGSSILTEKPEEATFSKASEDIALHRDRVHQQLKELSLWDKIASFFGFKSKNVKENEKIMAANAQADKEYVGKALIKTNREMAAKLVPNDPELKKQPAPKKKDPPAPKKQEKLPAEALNNKRTTVETIQYFRPQMMSGKITASQYKTIVWNARKRNDPPLPSTIDHMDDYIAAYDERLMDMAAVYAELGKSTGVDPEMMLLADRNSGVIATEDYDKIIENGYTDPEFIADRQNEIENEVEEEQPEEYEEVPEDPEHKIDRIHRESMEKARKELNKPSAKPFSYVAEVIRTDRQLLADNKISFNTYKSRIEKARGADEMTVLDPEKRDQYYRTIVDVYDRIPNGDTYMRRDMSSFNKQQQLFLPKEIDGIRNAHDSKLLENVDPTLLNNINKLKEKDETVRIEADEIYELDQDLRTMSKSQDQGVKNMAYELIHGGGEFATVVKGYQDTFSNKPLAAFLKKPAGLSHSNNAPQNQMQNQMPQNQMQQGLDGSHF